MMDMKKKRNTAGISRNRTTIRKLSLLVLILPLLGLNSAGCQQPRQFNDSKWNWSNWFGTKSTTTMPASPKADEAGPAKTTPTVSNMFFVQILKNAGSDRELREVWSYLDEASPISTDWKMLHRNGLRCGIGQYSDWPAVRAMLEKAGTKIQGSFQVTLSGPSPMNLLSDKMRSERTLFYYDRNGRVHGRDFGPSMMQLTMVSAGRISDDRVRSIFVPRLFKPETNLERLMPVEGKRSMVEMALNDFNITVDLGVEEFALIGPNGGDMADSLIGSQLFQSSEQGRRLSYFILISPMSLDAK
jgi:hypothetical protein